MFDIQTADEVHRVKAPLAVAAGAAAQPAPGPRLPGLGEGTAGPEERVFPSMYQKGSPLPSMWFARMLKTLGLKRPAVSLHSFRHTLTVKLAQARTFPPLQQRLLGHSLGKDVESRVYLAGWLSLLRNLVPFWKW